MNLLDYLLGLSPEFAALKRKVTQMANDYTELQAELEGIKTAAAETKATLKGLVDRILALENAPNDQATIDALVAEARTIREGMVADEDAADDHLPATPPTP